MNFLSSRALLALALPAALFIACGTTAPPSDESTGGTSNASGAATGSGGDEDCAIGSEGCACTQGGSCDGDLVCASELCVDLSGTGGGSSGGAPATGGNGSDGGMAGSDGSGGAASGGNSGGPDHCLNQPAVQSPGETLTDNDFHTTTLRDGIGYYFNAGYTDGSAIPELESISIAYAGSSFVIQELLGTGSQADLLLAPFVLCGNLGTNVQSSPACGLPLELDGATQVEFGARFRHGGDGSDFAYFIDMTLEVSPDDNFFISVAPRPLDGYDFSAFDVTTGVHIAGDPGAWNVAYRASGTPWVMFHRPPGEEGTEFAGDALDFIDYVAENYPLVGSRLLGIAASLVVFDGPVTDLAVEDFCVEAG